jgi:hypothetical protein
VRLQLNGYEGTKTEGAKMTTEDGTQLGEKSDGGTIGEKLLRIWREGNMKLQV